MPDRNYNFYPGMLLGGNGFIGDKGKSEIFPEGAPLIPTAERNNNGAPPAADIEYLRSQMSPAAFATLQEDLSTSNNKYRRNHQYIDSLNRNTSMGRDEKYVGQNFNSTANDTDLVF